MVPHITHRINNNINTLKKYNFHFLICCFAGIWEFGWEFNDCGIIDEDTESWASGGRDLLGFNMRAHSFTVFPPHTWDGLHRHLPSPLPLSLPVENETLDTPTSRLPLSMRGSGDIYGLRRVLRVLTHAPVIKEWFQSHYTTPPCPKRPLQHLPPNRWCTPAPTHQKKHIHKQKRTSLCLQWGF